MNPLIESYYTSVLNSVARLTGHSNDDELKTLTEEILSELRQREEEWKTAERKGVFVYQVVLIHVFAFLQSRGEEKRIALLRKILLIRLPV